jgi:Gram-negative bacterial TonB protein C-terminal
MRVVSQCAWAALMAAATVASSGAKSPTPVPNLFAFPAVNGGPIRSEVTVVYTSDGYSLDKCVLVGTTGNRIADAQACKTVNFQKANKPKVAKTWVWVPQIYEGNFEAPIPKSRPSEWFRISDYTDSSQHGVVTIRSDLDSEGKNIKCEIASTSGSETLDKLVERVLCSRVRYRAAKLNGTPVPSIVFNIVRLTNGS